MKLITIMVIIIRRTIITIANGNNSKILIITVIINQKLEALRERVGLLRQYDTNNNSSAKKVIPISEYY